MAATYKDIRKLTGLSLSTISKYFNGGTLIEENRKSIEKAIVKLDYHVNEYARGLKSNRSKTIGVLIPELNSTFHTSIIAEVEDILRRNGYGTIVCDSRLDKQIEKDSLEFLISKMVDGIITIPFDKSGKHLELADQRNIPVVLIDRLEDEYKTDAVIVDNTAAAQLAVNEFVENGHKDIAIICGPQGLFTMNARMEGFKKFLSINNIKINNDYLISGDIAISGGYEGAKKLLQLKNPPTALFCANYEITLGAIIAINESGFKIPNDISIIGFDNLTLSKVVKPSLTIITQPMREIAENAANLILERLESEKVSGTKIIELNPSIIKGKSVLKLQ